MAKTYDNIQLQTANIPEEVFIPSGIAAIDDMIGGFCLDEMTLFGGMTSHGKSLVLLASACRAAQFLAAEEIALYISLENTISTDTRRLRGFYKRYGMKPDSATLVLHWSEGDAMGVEGIEKLMQATLEKYNRRVALVYIDSFDYLTLDDGEVPKDGYSEGCAGGSIAQALRKLAISKHCAIIVSAQLNREAYSKKLTEISIGDMASSIKIPRVAHDVYDISKNELTKSKMKTDVWALKCLKARSGFREGYNKGDTLYMTSLGGTFDANMAEIVPTNDIGVPDFGRLTSRKVKVGADD